MFRDVKKRGKRKVLELDPAGRKLVEVSVAKMQQPHMLFFCSSVAMPLACTFGFVTIIEYS